MRHLNVKELLVKLLNNTFTGPSVVLSDLEHPYIGFGLSLSIRFPNPNLDQILIASLIKES